MDNSNLYVFITVPAVFAQNAVISGTVKDSQGVPIPVAFVYDAQYKNATYSDSTGNFQIKTLPATILIVTADGYNDAKVASVESKVLRLKWKKALRLL